MQAQVQDGGMIGEDKLDRRGRLFEQLLADQIAAQVGFQRRPIEDLLNLAGLHARG